MVIVIGSINLDLIATVSRLPSAGETVPAAAFSTSPGGKGANQALAAARARATVRLVGAVGRDAFAGEALSLLMDGGVDLSVRRVEGTTGVATILVGQGGENIIAVVAGANATVLPPQLAQTVIGEGDVVMLQHEIPLETVEAALQAAGDAGARSILNTAPYRAEAARFLAKADYIIANETEFDLYAGLLGLSGADREAQMRDFAVSTGKTIIVTLGGDGVVVASWGWFGQIPALPVDPVDTVGAGDTFCGYFGAGLAAGMPLHDALRRAAAAGSLACLRPGAQPSIPLAAEVDAALA